MSPVGEAKINDAAKPKTINTAVQSKLNNTMLMYFESKIWERLHGRISSILMVPQVNSPATESAAITTTKIVFRKNTTLTIIWKLSQTPKRDAGLSVVKYIRAGRNALNTARIISIIHVRARLYILIFSLCINAVKLLNSFTSCNL
ncbi:hypothetical protein D3C71_1477170 [compost metagenome]